MHLNPKITFEEFRATYQLVLASKRKATKKRSWARLALIALISLTLVVAGRESPSFYVVLTLYAILLLSAVILRALARRHQDRPWKRFYAEEQANFNGRTLTIDELGISSDRSDGKATYRMSWDVFIRRIEVADAFVFLPSPNTFVRIPKVTLTTPEQELIRKWSSTIPIKETK